MITSAKITLTGFERSKLEKFLDENKQNIDNNNYQAIFNQEYLKKKINKADISPSTLYFAYDLFDKSGIDLISELGYIPMYFYASRELSENDEPVRSSRIDDYAFNWTSGKVTMMVDELDWSTLAMNGTRLFYIVLPKLSTDEVYNYLVNYEEQKLNMMSLCNVNTQIICKDGWIQGNYNDNMYPVMHKVMNK